jgi:hypothetical protein
MPGSNGVVERPKPPGVFPLKHAVASLRDACGMVVEQELAHGHITPQRSTVESSDSMILCSREGRQAPPRQLADCHVICAVVEEEAYKVAVATANSEVQRAPSWRSF